MNVAFFKFVLKEFLYSLILDLIHRVYLAIYSLWCILFEFDGMIPCMLWWVAL